MRIICMIDSGVSWGAKTNEMKIRFLCIVISHADSDLLGPIDVLAIDYAYSVLLSHHWSMEVLIGNFQYLIARLIHRRVDDL